MKKILISLAFTLFSGAAFCTIVTVTTPGYSFSPATITINQGDTVNFSIASIHDVVEVSQPTYAANGNTPISGGFSTPYGGGMVFSGPLAVGTHWYVCEPHAYMGMKGRIIIQSATGIAQNNLSENISIYPAFATTEVRVKVAGETRGIVELSGIDGQVIDKVEVNADGNLFYLGDKPSGVYFITVTDENGNKGVKRVVKM